MSSIIRHIIGISTLIFIELLSFVKNLNLKRLICILSTLPRDMKLMWFYIRTNIYLSYYKIFNLTVFNVLHERAKKNSDTVFLIGVDGKQYTYDQIEVFSNKLAVFIGSQGFKEGDCIALVMESRPEFIMCWYGLGKIKIIPSFINNNLSSKQIKFCIEACKATGIIFDRELEDKVADIDLPDVKKYSFHGASKIFTAINLEHNLQLIPSINIKSKAETTDIFCYIFTSGTTGLPKPVVIKHCKILEYSKIFIGNGVNTNDRIYCFLPLYHAIGGLMIICGAIFTGTPIVIRKKFSSSNFVDNCIKYNINIFFYIGEICRYICNIPPSEKEKQLKFKLIMGNGLRTPVWIEIKNRFDIERIIEFYGSSEGNAYFANLDGKVGACGHLPTIIKDNCPFVFVKSDEDGKLILDEDGKPIVVKDNGVGQLISSLSPYNILTIFTGYLLDTDSEKKIVTDLFRKGDRYFLTGDLFFVDELGYLFFNDRTGDTYRWKGENCSTFELESYINTLFGVVDVAAYSVKLLGNEGSAGMAYIVLNDEIDPITFTNHINKLPTYQRPIFIRISSQIQLTSTMKHKKIEMKHQGYNIVEISDVILVYLKPHGYTRLTPHIYQEILSAKIGF